MCPAHTGMGATGTFSSGGALVGVRPTRAWAQPSPKTSPPPSSDVRPTRAWAQRTTSTEPAAACGSVPHGRGRNHCHPVQRVSAAALGWPKGN